MKELKVKITGKIDEEDWGDRDQKFKLILAKLNVICVEYSLELEDKSPDEYDSY